MARLSPAEREALTEVVAVCEKWAAELEPSPVRALMESSAMRFTGWTHRLGRERDDREMSEEERDALNAEFTAIVVARQEAGHI